ncbi:unnamed protein product [Ranitomeya imitator]|uniref:NR LBD domain-containing protein n=1 Tax=Ranitomeya imitator TaxID=111125 RepID=A0ABN9M1I7_9NEOB|nr:unnamed protein product [Ranitomeya imitator]
MYCFLMLRTSFHSSQLTMPSPMPEYLNVHYICESASRLLFLSIHWARSIPSFHALGPCAPALERPAMTSRSCDRYVITGPALIPTLGPEAAVDYKGPSERQEVSISLVKACWNELFSLGLAQCSQVMNVSTILTAFVNHLHGLQHDKLSGDKLKLVMDHIFKLQDFCTSMVKLGLDGYEYAYLKAIVLFSPGYIGGLSTALQNAVDKPLMPVGLAHLRFWG